MLSTTNEAKLPRQRKVEITSATETVRVTLSLPPDGSRSTDRRKVLERARRMLAVALEEEKLKEQPVKTQQVQAREAKPGCGAWWLF